MATITAAVTNIRQAGASAHSVLWETLTTTNDIGSAQEIVDVDRACIQITGTFGVGGSVSLIGSNDGTNFSVLDDKYGDALTFTAAGVKEVGDLPRYVKPNLTAGDGATDLDATLLIVHR